MKMKKLLSIFLLLSCFGVISSPAIAQDTDHILMIAKDRAKSVTLSEYGGVDFRVDPDFDNAPAFNAYCTAVNAGTEKRALDLRGFWAGIKAEIDFPTKHGMVWLCAGPSMNRGEGDWLAGAEGIGGPSPARIIWTGTVGGGECMIEYDSPSFYIDGILNLQGYTANTYADLKASAANYADCGFKIKSRDTEPENVSYGKIKGGGIHVIALKTGIQGGTTATGLNGDDIALQSVRGMHCVRTLDLVSEQCVVITFGEFIVAGDPIADTAKQYGMRIGGGGHLSCQTSSMEVDGMTMVYVDDSTGDEAGPSLNNALIDLGQCWIDSHLSSANTRVIECTKFSDIQLRGRYQISQGVIATPLFGPIRGRAGLEISGIGMYEEMIETHEFNDDTTPSGFHPYVSVGPGRMGHRSGNPESATNMIHPDSSGGVNVHLQGVAGWATGMTTEDQHWTDGEVD